MSKGNSRNEIDNVGYHTWDSTVPVDWRYGSNSPVDYDDSYSCTLNVDVQLSLMVSFVVVASTDFESIERFHRSLYGYALANCHIDRANSYLNINLMKKKMFFSVIKRETPKRKLTVCLTVTY